MKKNIFLLTAIVLLFSCNRGVGVSEQRVTEIVDSILISNNLIQSNQINPNILSNIDSFIGTWTDGDNIDIEITKNKEFVAWDPVCFYYFAYEESSSELLLEFEDAECKWGAQYESYIGKEFGKCSIKNGELILEINTPELAGIFGSSLKFKQGSRFD